MSSFCAFIITIFSFLIFFAPVFYFIFIRSDDRTDVSLAREEGGVNSFDDFQVEYVQKELDVKLPKEYVDFVKIDRPFFIDSTALIDDAFVIIELTKRYRLGEDGLPKWPNSYVYIGDEADACPYVIDCQSNKVFKLDKGNVDRPPLLEFDSFQKFIDFYKKMMGLSE
ncbi:SMI1/KNR4 family protein [Microbulbifer thermotolerans]|uniref:hypothetical protein n=1 Tax=Microbulbifer thermotolerans TaxID=252514 RepID=UPI0022492064|nr:hypothetical protein [Microbulbifer thermotolerans]MCX2831464.1 SMI1/KNR4 family protein [Microbulbifer thermotolerans]MCX2835350.1 SMI1/KNR4 family protein [Microbulbifer thermotolerans]